MSLKKSELAAAEKVIAPATSAVITVHTRPDVDAIGSALALARGLRRRCKEVVVLSQDPVPDSCAWLPDVDTVQRKTSERRFDLGIICDCDSPERVGDAAEVVTAAKHLVIIDHHAPRGASVPPDALCLSDVTAAATAELIFELLHGLRLFLDEVTAEQLMAGIVGDTGGFRFSNVTVQTLEFASRLVALGASPSRAAREIYENRSINNTKLLGVALLNLQFDEHSGIAWSRITHQDFVRLNACDSDTESIVNHVRAVKGAKVGVLFRELEENDVRVSLRSWGDVDANKIAGVFGGGGHVAAAGLTIEQPLEDAERAVLAEVRKWMAS